MNDLIATASFAGATAFLYKQVLNHILYYTGITTFLYKTEAATLMLPIGLAGTLYGSIIGLLADLVLVTWFALVIAYILNNTGYDYAILKGAFVGASSWVIVYGFFVHLGLLGLYKTSGITAGLTTIFFDITMGMVSAYVLVYLKHRTSIKR